MTSADFIEWIIDDSLKPGNYRGFMQRPFTRRENVSEGLEKLRKKANQLDKQKRLDRFLSKHSETVLSKVEDEIRQNNADWEVQFMDKIGNAKTENDIGELQNKLRREGQNYEDKTVKNITESLSEAQKTIAEALAKPKSEFTSSQKDRIRDVTGYSDEEIDQIGLKGIRQAIEADFMQMIESASSTRELERIEDRLSEVPTKAATSRLKSDIRRKRSELENVES